MNKSKKNGLNIKWLQIFVTAIITGLISLIVAIVVFNYTTEKVELVYEEFPISTFKNNHTKLGIINYSIRNNGQKPAKDVIFLIELPESATIKEPNIKTSNKLTKYEIERKSTNSILYKIESLYPYETCNFSFLAENILTKENVNVELRSKESIGKLYTQSNDSISPIVVYISLIIGVVLIILILVLLFSIKKASNAFRLFRKKLSQESEIEERKVNGIIEQGVDYCDMGLIDDSIVVLLKGKYLHPEASSIHSNLARAYAKKGNFDKAEAEYKIAEKLIETDSDEIILHYTKAHYFAIRGEKEKMLESLKKAQSVDKQRVIEKMKLDDEFDNYHEDTDFKKLVE